MTRHTRHTTTIQTWPGGHMYTYRGDPHGPANQRSLKDAQGDTWRKGTDEEWRRLRVAVLAELYASRDVLHCDSSLVDDLINAAQMLPSRSDLGKAFQDDAIENVYKDPSDWDAATCREYASDEQIDVTTVIQTSCQHCDQDIEGHAPFSVGDWRDRGNNTTCPNDSGEKHAPLIDPDDDDDYLDELRHACREYAQEHPAEVFEWWRVSSWLAEQLRGLGYVVLDNGYGTWWGRTCSGQALIMDGTLQAVAAQFVKDGDA